MNRDIRETALYREAEALYEGLRQPGAGRISDAAEVHASPNGKHAVFAGTLVEKLEGAPPTRICHLDLLSGDCRVLTFGPNTDRLPRYSPDGLQVAFLSDRHREGDFQLYLLDSVNGGVRSTPPVEGWVEYLQWSPDGQRILLGVAGHGADVSGGQGAITSKQASTDVPRWVPNVETGNENYRWRRAWVYELATGRIRQVSNPDVNVWESTWCGNDSLAAVVSLGAGEGLWYSAHLSVLEIETGESTTVFTPLDQLGWPSAAPSGKYLAIVEAICSDRWLVAGDLRLIDTTTGQVARIDTGAADITYTEWRSERHLLLAGHRGFDSVVGLYDAILNTYTEVWSSREVTTGGRYITISGFNEPGDCILVGESFLRAPEIGTICGTKYRSVKPFDLGYSEEAKSIGAVETVSWNAPDGLEIQGWLLLPHGQSPFPVVMFVHGGPVWHWRPTWLGRTRSIPVLMLIKCGYAVFLPNPRGSAGRGQDFARRVVGDMGGADTYDYLSGLDHLVERQIADPSRLGVTGGSYGGFMAAWLITQDSRFAAAVPLAPVTNHVTEYLVSNIPHFVSLFLADSYANPGGKYFQRSPIMHAHKVKTPTLNICGALDRCTPPGEAMQFHNALLQYGVKSVLVTYPEEGHGIQKWPAAIDYAARTLAWFREHMSAEDQPC